MEVSSTVGFEIMAAMKLKITLAKYIKEGQRFPKGFGLAYWETWNCVAVCYPIPLNFLIRMLRNIWYYVRCPKTPPWERKWLRIRKKLLDEKTILDREKIEIFNSGRRIGRKEALTVLLEKGRRLRGKHVRASGNNP